MSMSPAVGYRYLTCNDTGIDPSPSRTQQQTDVQGPRSSARCCLIHVVEAPVYIWCVLSSCKMLSKLVVVDGIVVLSSLLKVLSGLVVVDGIVALPMLGAIHSDVPGYLSYPEWHVQAVTAVLPSPGMEWTGHAYHPPVPIVFL